AFIRFPWLSKKVPLLQLLQNQPSSGHREGALKRRDSARRKMVRCILILTGILRCLGRISTILRQNYAPKPNRLRKTCKLGAAALPQLNCAIEPMVYLVITNFT